MDMPNIFVLGLGRSNASSSSWKSFFLFDETFSVVDTIFILAPLYRFSLSLSPFVALQEAKKIMIPKKYMNRLAFMFPVCVFSLGFVVWSLFKRIEVIIFFERG